METTKILFIAQEITPYLPESEIGSVCRFLPQAIQEKGREIRTFMPRYGCVNERRNQLHEVIRLSGMNLIIDDSDHPLIIKVASIQSARMQVYFIDNDDFFQRKYPFADENGEYEDNEDRLIFFVRGVLETVKKLRWTPDIIHCHGWISSLIPLYVKKAFNSDPFFKNSKIVYSIYSDEFKKPFSRRFGEKVKIEGVCDSDIHSILGKAISFADLSKFAIEHSDAVIQGSSEVDESIVEHIKQLGVPFLTYQSTENYAEAYNEFYNSVLNH